MRAWFIRFALWLACVVMATGAPAAEKKIRLTFTETSLGNVPAGAQRPAFSPDGKHAAYSVKTDAGWYVVVDGKPHKTYEWILAKSLVFSPDSNRLAYVAVKGDQMMLVLDGVEGKPCRDIGHITFSPDGRRLAYAARMSAGAKTHAVVLDDVPGKEYENPRSLMFSPDSKHFAFAANAPGGKRRWIIDGQEQPLFDALGPLVFSADSSRYGYVGERGDRCVVMVDGKEHAAHDRAGGLRFSPDGKHIVFVAEKMAVDEFDKKLRRKYVVIHDGVESKAYDGVGEPVLSPDGLHLAYMAKEGKLWRVVEDGKPHEGLHDFIDLLTYSADSRHLAYRAVDELHQKVVVDGKEGKQYDQVGSIALSADASTVAYGARAGGNEWLVLNGKELPSPGKITMSPGGRWVAHGDDRLVDGKFLKTVVLVNGVEGRTYDGLVAGSNWVFDGPDRFYMMVGREKELIRVEVKITEE